MNVLFVVPYTMSRGGTEAVMMNLIRNFSADVRVDVVETKSSKKGLYDEEIKSLGKGSIYYIPSEKHFLGYIRGLRDAISKGNYDVVHAHFLDDRSYFPMKVAKDCGVPVRIAHIHDTKHISGSSLPAKVIAGYLNWIGKRKLSKVATSFFACSTEAGQDYFPFLKERNESFILVRNAVDLEKYAFNFDKRERARQELGISDDTFVLGQVGRLSLEQKNQLFTIKVFSRLLKTRPNSRLVLIGSGADLLTIKNTATKLKIDSKILIITNADSAKYYSSFDCFILPSFYEGLCVAAIEAQCNGLPCVLSDQMTSETVLCPNVVQLSLEDSIDNWVSAVTGLRRIDNSREILAKSGYDVRNETKQVEEFYKNFLRRLQVK